METVTSIFASAGTATEPGSPLVENGYVGNDQPTASDALALGGVAAASFATGVDVKLVLNVSSSLSRTVNLPSIDGPSGTTCLYMVAIDDTSDPDIMTVKTPTAHGFSSYSSFKPGDTTFRCSTTGIAANTFISSASGALYMVIAAVKA